jgi:hypothetical protein
MRASALDSFIRKTVEDNKPEIEDPAAARDFAHRMEKLLRLDYRAALRRLFLRREVRDLIAAGARIAWPLLNQEPLPYGTLRSYVKRSAERGITLILSNESSAKSVLGFYLPRTLGLSRPMIWLNTAVKQRAIIAAAITHETGHHIAKQVLGESIGSHRDFHTTEFGSLDDRQEAAADLFVSIAALPHAMATAMFRQPGGNLKNLRRAYHQMCERYGVVLPLPAGREGNLVFLFGSFHYLKLREALLTEFGV